MTVYTEESRECLRVKPSESGEERDVEDLIDQIASLHDLHQEQEGGIINSIMGGGREPVRFELLAICSGCEFPVELYYSCDYGLETLKRRLDAIYPQSFTIEETTVDIGASLITPVEYAPSEFIEAVKDGRVAYSLDDLTEDVSVAQDSSFGGELPAPEPDTEDEMLVPAETVHGDREVLAPIDRQEEPNAKDPEQSEGQESQSTRKPSTNESSGSESGSGPNNGEFETSPWQRTADVPADHRYLRLDDKDGKAIKVDPSSKLDEVDSKIELERPTFTDDRKILARPSRDEVEPTAVRWQGLGVRSGDWMTTLRSDDTAKTEDTSSPYYPKPTVVGELLTQLSEIETPVVLQVVFERKTNWKSKAMGRKSDLKNGEDTIIQSAVSAVTGPTDGENQSTDVRKRINLIEEKNPKRTFDVNIRAVGVDPERSGPSRLDEEEDGEDIRTKAEEDLRKLVPAFDPIDGQYYQIEGTLVDDCGKVVGTTPSTPRDELNYLLDRELRTSDKSESLLEKTVGSSLYRSEIVLNARELADIITIPAGEEMPKQAFRGTRVKHEEENPLPRPNPEILEGFSEGMAVGCPLDENRNVIKDPVRIPAKLLETHYARFATTGFGKSIATNNDILTIHEATPGPEILIDPKGDGMCDRYLEAHFARFDSLDDIYYFNVPEDLPAIAFFDIRPLLAQGRSREDAIQDKVDHFHEIMRMVMGDAYDNAYVAIMVLSFLIKAMFDPEYGVDAFTLDDLYEQALRMQREERVPRISEDRQEVEQSLSRHFDNEEGSFKETMTAVLNRLDKLREDTHLYRMFNHLPKWDYEQQRYSSTTPSLLFQEFFDDDVVVLFDIGDLRPNAARAMTLVLLSGLWDDIRERDKETDYPLVNLIIEEAAPYAATDLMTEHMLPKARAFNLSLGLIMQYPGQVKAENERTYDEIRNNVHSTMFGKIEDDQDIANALATQDLDPVTLKTKLTSMRKGEWLVDLPGSEFDIPEPSPFSIKALPIPDGHPESKNPLDGKDIRKFERAHLPRCRSRVQDRYSIQRRVRDRDEAIESSKTAPATATGSSSGEADETAESEAVTETETASTAGGTAGSPAGLDEEDEDSGILEVGPEDAPDGIFDWDDSQEVKEASSISAAEDDNLFVDDEPAAVEDSSTESMDGETVEPEPEPPSEPEPAQESEPTPTPAPGSTPPDDSHDTQSGGDAGVHGSEGPDTDSADQIISVEPGEADQWETAAEESTDGSFLDGIGAETGEDSPGATTEAIEVPEAQRGPPENRPPQEVADPPETPTGPDTTSQSDTSEQVVSEADPEPLSDPEAYESVEDVYDAAREINASLSGPDRFKALMELSAAVEEDGIDVDDDQLATLSGTPDKSAQDTGRPNSTSGSQQGTDKPEDSPETELEDASQPEESDTAPAEERGSEDGESQSNDGPPVDRGSEPSSSGGEDRDHAESQRQIDDFAERVSQRCKEQPDFSEQPVEDSEITLSDDSEEFLHLILSAMNDELDDYSILSLESMNSLVKQVGDPDIERLKDLDMIEEHRVIRKRFFTVLPAGREYLQRSLTSRDGVGDLGEKTPHKVGVAILWHYVTKHEKTARVDRYQTVGDEKYDVVGYDSEGDVVVVGEAETPTNNWESIVTDYEKMADLEEEAIWLCKNHDTALEVIKALEQRGVLEEEFTPTQKKSFSTLMDTVSERELAGMDEIKAFTSLYDDLNT